MKIQTSPNLQKLARIYPANLYIVGGYVRNSVMEIELEDVDLAGPITLDELASILEKTEFSMKVKSKTLGTAIISDGETSYEYSCFRREVYGDNGEHSPEKVEFIDSIVEDAKRRDFTINALYYDIKKEEIIDFYDGLGDIKRKVLRTVETPEFVMSKDGARVLRLFRFMSELNFKVEKETLLAAIKYADNVKGISNERRISEITKILHSPKRYKISKQNAFMRAFRIFNHYGVWSSFGLDVPRIKFNMVKKVEHKSQGFLIDLIDTVNPISVTYYLERVLEELGVNKKLSAHIINVLGGYYAALNHESNKPYFFKYFENFPTIYLLISKKSMFWALKYEFFYKYIISHKLVISVKDLAINGDDIKKYYPEVNPKRYKAILESLLSDVFDCKIENERKQLIQAVNGKLKFL